MLEGNQPLLQYWTTTGPAPAVGAAVGVAAWLHAAMIIVRTIRATNLLFHDMCFILGLSLLDYSAAPPEVVAFRSTGAAAFAARPRASSSSSAARRQYGTSALSCLK